MSKEALEQELEELWQEYNSFHEAAKEVMMTIDMVKSDLENLDEQS